MTGSTAGEPERAAETERVACVWCESENVERLGDYAYGLMTEQWFCRECHSPFERIIKRGEPLPDGE